MVPSVPDLYPSHRRWASQSGYLVIAVGCLALVGWRFEIALFRSVIPGFGSMNPMTALAFILSGAALRMSVLQTADRRIRLLGRVCGLAVGLLGFLRLCEYQFGWDLGVNVLLFKEQVLAVSPAGRMAATTALNFLLLGLVFTFQDVEPERGRRFAEPFILLAMFLSMTAVIGFIYDNEFFYHSSMALNTALTFLLLCSGLLCARSDYGFMKILFSNGLGGVVARGLIPAAIGLSLLLEWTKLAGQQAGWYDAETGSAMFTAFRIVIMVGFIWWISTTINRIDAERQSNDEKLRESRERSQLLLDSTAEAIYGINLQGLCTFCNASSLRLLGYSAAEDLIGKNMHDLVHHSRPDGSPYPVKECKLYKAFQAGQEIQHGDEVIWRADGSSFPIEYWSYPIQRNGVTNGSVVAFIDITERKRAENEVKQTNAKLTDLVVDLEARKREMSLLSEMGDLLQTCRTLQEANDVILRSLRHLFPTESGALYMLMASRNLVERTVTWGSSPPEEHLFPPDDCWALRKGQVHRVDDSDSGLICPHVKQPLSTGYLCIPMQAQNDILGILHLTLSKSDDPDGSEDEKEHLKKSQQRLAGTVAEQIALALSNILLRDVLRNQAIRDSLTGLFNRRFLEEMLVKEICRAERGSQPIGVFMIDIDHFKQFNDTHGHEAGDAVLNALGQFLKEKIRGGDTACRYGGEEFTIILPGASLEDSLRKARSLCEAVKQLKPQFRGRSLEGITLSLGVAVFPDHGSNAEDLLRAADQALYQAKAEGRDRVAGARTPV